MSLQAAWKNNDLWLDSIEFDDFLRKLGSSLHKAGPLYNGLLESSHKLDRISSPICPKQTVWVLPFIAQMVFFREKTWGPPSMLERFFWLGKSLKVQVDHSNKGLWKRPDQCLGSRDLFHQQFQGTISSMVRLKWNNTEMTKLAHYCGLVGNERSSCYAHLIYSTWHCTRFQVSALFTSPSLAHKYPQWLLEEQMPPHCKVNFCCSLLVNKKCSSILPRPGGWSWH